MGTLRPLHWEKGNDKNQQATWYGLLEKGEQKVLLFSVRPASNDKKTGYFLNCSLNQLFKMEPDSKMYDAIEDARSSAERTLQEVVKIVIDLPPVKPVESSG